VQINAEKNKNSDRSTGTDETRVQKPSSRKGHKITKLLRPVSNDVVLSLAIIFYVSAFIEN
jgi:hypothetical protein